MPSSTSNRTSSQLKLGELRCACSCPLHCRLTVWGALGAGHSVAATAMRNELAKLSNTIKDPEMKQVSFIYCTTRSCVPYD